MYGPTLDLADGKVVFWGRVPALSVDSNLSVPKAFYMCRQQPTALPAAVAQAWLDSKVVSLKHPQGSVATF